MDERSAKPRVSAGEFFKQVKAEARKVVWPTAKETYVTSAFVAVLMAILAVFFLGVDYIFGSLVRWLLTLAS